MKLRAKQRILASSSGDEVQKKIVDDIRAKLSPSCKVIRVGDAHCLVDFRAKIPALRQTLNSLAHTVSLDLSAKVAQGKPYLCFTLYDESLARICWVTYDTLYGMLYVQV